MQLMTDHLDCLTKGLPTFRGERVCNSAPASRDSKMLVVTKNKPSRALSLAVFPKNSTTRNGHEGLFSVTTENAGSTTLAYAELHGWAWSDICLARAQFDIWSDKITPPPHSWKLHPFSLPSEFSTPNGLRLHRR